MGQYYKTIIKPEHEDKTGLKAVCTLGYKLLEHNYFDNRHTDMVTQLLHNRRCQVAEMGDYADYYLLNPECQTETFKKKSNERKLDLAVMYHLYRFDDNIDYTESSDQMNYNVDYKPQWDYNKLWFVNHDKKIGINLGKSREKNRLSKDLSIYTPNLLCAVGNGLGGGDYYDELPNFEDVGAWAGDIVEIIDFLPVGYTEDTKTYFKEEY